MVADWIGAGNTYGQNLGEWLPKNLPRFWFDKETATTLKWILEKLGHDIQWLNYQTYNLGVRGHLKQIAPELA